MRLIVRRSEREALDALVAHVAVGASRVVVVRGESGVVKDARLRYLSDRCTGWRVSIVRASSRGWSWPPAGCINSGPDARLPRPAARPAARRASDVFGMSEGTPPDRFVVGLATLALAAEAAEQQPRLCIVEDAQWLDHASAQVFGFAGRRLLAERVALVAAPRAPTGDQVLADLPEMSINGLDDSDARTLLLENVPGASPLQCATRSSPNATAIHSPSSRSRAVYRLCSAARMRSPFHRGTAITRVTT